MNERPASTILEQVHADLLLDIQKLLLETETLKKDLPQLYKNVTGDVENAAKVAQDAFKDMESMARALAIHTNKAKSDFEIESEALQAKISKQAELNAKTITAGFSPFTKHLWLLSALVGCNLLISLAFGLAYLLK
ncbi:hypothetical protein SAMN05216339_101403 [Nitrosomonas eutropha]|uniref:Uncharacterized protein n=1 Tax=Nitrosomonas eutropha TaxID=916 RepID=A0A1I7FBV7_9PROT|nr:hypothetical protein [Nitrosomonas eutropha]SFU33654.1 hypothetical protein SAMN05216339_101403 [Nitrosomonas eutropha]